MKVDNVYVQTSFGGYKEDFPLLRASGGDLGGGQRSTCPLLYTETIGSLCATDYKWVQQEQVMQGKLIVCADIGGEHMEQRKYILRRLTPLECSRLQGFPDWWVSGVEGSDSNIYKMWGNGIALPCAADVMGRIAKELEGEDNGETD